MTGYQPTRTKLLECKKKSGRHHFLTAFPGEDKTINAANQDRTVLLINPDFIALDLATRHSVGQKKLKVSTAVVF